MIKSITVTNYLGDSIKLDLARPELSGFAVLSITGLGPGTSTINTTEVSTGDGGIFNSARLSVRNIVISLGFLWKNSIEEVRHQSYKYFPLKKKLTLLFETDTRMAEIEGYVESNDPAIFSSQEGSDISIICPDPLFYAVGENSINVTTFSAIEPLFEFPFGNESLDTCLLEVGKIHDVFEKSVVYEGDADTGVTINIHAVGEASNIMIYNPRTRETMTIDTTKLESLVGSGISAGDDIVICTIKGKKSIKFVRDGKTTNLLGCLSKDSKWFQITKGDNVFGYTAETGSGNLQFRIENRIVYEGV